MMKNTRILWLHNFDPAIPQAGVFMWTAFNTLVRRDKIRTYEVAYSGQLGRLSSVPRSIRNIARGLSNADIVHVQYGSLLFFLSCLLNFFYRRTVVVSLRGSDIFVGNKSGIVRRVHNAAAVTLTKLTLKLADHVITVSEKMTERVVSCGYPREKITCLPSPLHASFLSHRLSSTERGRRVFFSALNPHSPNKRFSLAQGAVALLPDVDLFLATDLDRKEFQAELATCSVVLLTSVSEGWPNVVKEGLAMGVPFVATDVSDLSSVSKASNGVCHVCEDTPEALASALSEVLDRDLTIEQRAALRSLVDQFSAESYADRVASIYESIHA